MADGLGKTMLKKSTLKENSQLKKVRDKHNQENISYIKRDKRDFSRTKSDLGSYEVTQPSNRKEALGIAVSPNPESPLFRKTENDSELFDQSKAGSKKNGQLQPSNPNQKTISQLKKQYDDTPAANIRPNRTDMGLPCFKIALQ